MDQISLITEIYHQQRNQEVLEEAQQYRLAAQALQARKQRHVGRSRFFAWVGKQLSSLGTALEQRYGGKPGVDNSGYQHRQQGDYA